MIGTSERGGQRHSRVGDREGRGDMGKREGKYGEGGQEGEEREGEGREISPPQSFLKVGAYGTNQPTNPRDHNTSLRM